jgi:hypothetical protein
MTNQKSKTKNDIVAIHFSFIVSNFPTGAGDEVRTRDPQLGRLMLYQLSYARMKKIREQQTESGSRIRWRGNLFDSLSKSAKKSLLRYPVPRTGTLRL